MHRVKQIATLTDFDFVIRFDCSRRFKTYSNTNLMKITRVVMNEVIRIVPVDFIVEMKLLLNVPFKVFLFLSYVKYHYTTLAWIQNSLKP